MSESELQIRINRVQSMALLVGGAALALCIVVALIWDGARAQFFHAYLMAFMLWIGLALGSLGLLALHHLVGGRWGYVIRRTLEASAWTVPVMAVLFIPVLLGMYYLYPWSNAPISHNPLVAAKQQYYLNVPGFIGRAVVYFVIWFALSWLLNRWSMQEDQTGERLIRRRMQRLSGPALVLYALTVNFAAIDWCMSLEPDWYSTIFGLLFVAGQGVNALAVAIIVLMLLSGAPPLSSIVQRFHFHDLGSLLFAFVMLWAYMSFSQYLIIWSGNITHEVGFYTRRIFGFWKFVTVLLMLLHFALPFVLLLSRYVKKNPRLLAAVAAGLVVMRCIDLFWIIQPSMYADRWTGLMVPLLPVGIGGIWIAAFLYRLKGRPLLPLHPGSEFTEAHAHG